MTADDDRRAELVAAALAGELSAEEHAELDAMAADDATVGAELAEMTELLTGLRSAVPPWQEERPPAELRAQVLAAACADASTEASLVREDSSSGKRADDHGDSGSAPEAGAQVSGAGSGSAAGGSRGSGSGAAPRRGRRHQAWALVACFLAGVLVAAGGYLGANALRSGPPDGPPGTLGAIEEVTFDQDVPGARIDGVLVAHTWGTETILEIEGLPPGAGYALVLIDEDGQEYHSGTFFGSDVVIDCRMNAAVMRAEVDRLEIREEAGGVLIAASLPEAVDDRG